MSSAVKIGVLGCASIAERAMIPAILGHSGAILAGVASRQREKAKSFAERFGCHAYTSYDDLISSKDVDAIYLPLPTGLHLLWILKALHAGKHVFCEKSLAANYQEASEITDLAIKKNLVVKENYMFEYHRQQAEVIDLVNREVGDIRVFRAFFGFPPLEPNNFRYNRVLGGGALLDAGGYVLKAMSTFFPFAENRICSAITTQDSVSGVDISGAIAAEIEVDGVIIPAHLAYGFDHVYQCGVEFWGSKGKLTTNRTFTAGRDFMPSAFLVTDTGTETISLPKDDHFTNILSDFLTSIREHRTLMEAKCILKQAALQQSVRELGLKKLP